MTLLDKKTKGSFHYLTSCGRKEQMFYPFSMDVPTTLRVKRAVDRIYNVRHHYSSKEKRAKTPKLASRVVVGESEVEKAIAQRRDFDSEQRQAMPTCCTYNPVKSSNFLNKYGQIKIRFGTEPRLMPPPLNPDQPVGEVGDDAVVPAAPSKPKPELHNRQVTNKPPKHIPGASFARSVHINKSLRKRAEAELQQNAASEKQAAPKSPPKPKTVHPQGISPDLLVPGIPAMGPSPHRGGISRTPRKTMQGYYWSNNSAPNSPAQRDKPSSVTPRASATPSPSYSHKDKHIPSVSMGRTSGRVLYNGAKQNATALEKLLKKVCQEQAAHDKKSDAWKEPQSVLFGNNNRGVDIWMVGSRHERAVQGVCSGADPLSAKWVIEEADSINRVQAASRAADSPPRSAALMEGSNSPNNNNSTNNNGTQPHPTRATTYGMKLRAELGASAAAAAAEADFANTLKAVDDTNDINITIE